MLPGAAAKDLAGGVRAGAPGHAAARVSAGSAEEQALDGQPVARVAEERPPREQLVEPVLAHRVIVAPDAQVQGITAADVMDEILRELPVPTGVRPG